MCWKDAVPTTVKLFCTTTSLSTVKSFLIFTSLGNLNSRVLVVSLNEAEISSSNPLIVSGSVFKSTDPVVPTPL